MKLSAYPAPFMVLIYRLVNVQSENVSSDYCEI
ncbi:hypothetical protein YPPY58_2585, partial [Yersinia pestis PY-58]